MYPEKIRLLRERKGLTQGDIAKILNTTQQQYSRYENGTEMPYGALIILSKFYEVSIDYLLGQTKQQKKED